MVLETYTDGLVRAGTVAGLLVHFDGDLVTGYERSIGKSGHASTITRSYD